LEESAVLGENNEIGEEKMPSYIVIYKRAKGLDVPLGTFTKRKALRVRKRMVSILGYAPSTVKVRKLRRISK
jgi:hypothetical protein